MPIPKRKKTEKRKDFINRCMSNPKMNAEYPDAKQRSAVCYNQAKSELTASGQLEDIEESLHEIESKLTKIKNEDEK